ncbi:extensin-like [Helianthus annuus]|uniref:extensin-like n=1 Tax=Helianthus annuus TaxID=4232 RepID=UPI000B9047E2|nr:extensin-like [Helianthus annuus]
MNPPPPPTTGEPTPPFIPSSTQPSPNITTPASTPEIKPTNTTLPENTQSEYSFSYNPTSSAVPAYSTFFPTASQPSSSQIPPPNLYQTGPSIIHSTPFQPRVQFQHTSRVRQDGFDDEFEDDFVGYDEEGYMYGGDGDQGEYTYVQGQNQRMSSVGGIPQQQIIPQQLPPQGPQVQR